MEDLAPGVAPGVSPLFSPSGLVYRYVVESPDRSPMEQKIIQDWVLEKQYKSVPGVADMSSLGGLTMQYQVVLDPTRLAGAGLSVPAVAAALGANDGNAGGGFYSEGGQFYYVRGLGRLERPEDIGSVVLEGREKLAAHLRLPEGYVLAWGGAFENMERANARLLLVVPITLVGFGLLAWLVSLITGRGQG